MFNWNKTDVISGAEETPSDLVCVAWIYKEISRPIRNISEKRNVLPVRAAPVAVLGSSVGAYSFSILSTTRSAILFWSSSCVSLKSRIAVSFTYLIQEVETRTLRH